MKTKITRLILATFATLIIAGCVTASSWEYRTLTTDARKGPNFLDQHYGKSGWELVSCTVIPKDQSGTNFQYQYIFKRPKK